MGYYITLQDSSFRIPKESQDEAFERLKALNHKPGVPKSGGGFRDGEKVESWFSWMAPDYDEHVSSLAELFGMLGFTAEFDKDGALLLTHYDDKIGDEKLFLEEIADLVPEGAIMDWVGEDGERWRYQFDGESMHTLEGRVTITYDRISHE